MGAADTATVKPVDAGAKEGKPGAQAAGGSSALLRGLKLILAFLLIPACVGFSVAFRDYFVSLPGRLSIAVWGFSPLTQWFLLGAAGFGLTVALLWRPVALYVFAHEIVHALATWLCLGKVSNLRASAHGGKVTTSKSNTFIRLAPYVVPFYALLAAFTYCGLNAWWRPLDNFRWLLALALGFLTAFHLGFTLWSLHHSQPDLQTDGWVFSLVVVYLGNLFGLAAAFGLLYSGLPSGAWEALRQVACDGWTHSATIYLSLWALVSTWLPRR